MAQEVLAVATDATHGGLGADYAPFGAEHVADPYVFSGRARAEEPVFFSPYLDAWVVTRYEDAVAVLKDHRRFAISVLRARETRQTPEARTILARSPILATSLVQIDPPEHTRMRGCISRALSGQRIAGLEPRIRALSDRLIDRFEPDGRGDFVARFAQPFPIMVIGSLLDVPEADFPQLQRWSYDVAALLYGEVPPEEQAGCARSYVAVNQYVLDMADRRRLAPGHDLASDLVRAVEAGEAPLSASEVGSMLRILLIAGYETTVKLLGSCLLHLLSRPERWRSVVEDPTRVPAVVEEALRFDGPVLGSMRTAREAVELGGRPIPQGAAVWVLNSSANRDEAVFPDGETFDPDRERPAGHLAFGYGVHFCIGAPLARLETRIALERLAARLPSLRLVADQEISYRPNMILRGLHQLLVEWDRP